MEEILSPPTAAALMESTRSIGYSFESAVADIIDNSISANATNVWIVSIPDDDPYITILDDGEGLDGQQLKLAMRYGVDPNIVRDSNDLGRFGLGLKMASLSQCRKLTVVSKCNEDIHTCRWDLDRVIETDKWTLQVLSEEDVSDLPQINELKNLEHGTLVVWENLDKIKNRATDVKKSMTEALTICRDHIRLVFHRFMDAGFKSLSIYMNNNKLEPFDPFLTQNTKSTEMQHQKIEIDGEIVEIIPHILPVESSLTKKDVEKMGGIKRNLQGFWVYRNKRLIVPGTWFRLNHDSELTNIARVCVDIPNTLDYIWDVDVKKSSAMVPARFQKDFQKVLGQIVEKSKRKHSFRGRKESDAKKQFFWNKISFKDSYSYHININHPVIKKGYDELNEESKTWFRQVLHMIEETLPYNDIFNTMGEAKLKQTDYTKEEISKIVIAGIELIESGITLDELKKTEPFMDNDEILKKLEAYDESR